MPVKAITYCGTHVAMACDGKCHKAWGISSRPRVQLSENVEDYAYLADHELGRAPRDPGTYEGTSAKPTKPEEMLNKWCARQCERVTLADYGEPVTEFPDFTKRIPNIKGRKMPLTSGG